MAGDVAYTIEHQSHQRSELSVRKWEIEHSCSGGITPFAIRRQEGCQQFETCGIEAQTSLVCERQRSGNMQPYVSGTPPIVEADIQKMGAQTKLNHNAD